MDRIEYRFFYWGPHLWRTQLPDNIWRELKTRGESLTVKHNTKLASNIDQVYRFEKDDYNWMIEKLTPYFTAYLQSMETYKGEPNDFKGVNLETVWINFQRQHETNTEHTHSGDFSFVIYLQVPDKIKEENKQYVGSQRGPGYIMFRYGEEVADCLNKQEFFPEEGQMFIFPAKLAHWVVPFHSDCVRISISGNLSKVY
jgi:hypothetical protein